MTDTANKEVVREAMRILGKTKSEKKRIASIQNGKKGGNPKFKKGGSKL